MKKARKPGPYQERKESTENIQMLRVAENTLYILKYFKKKNRETYTVSEQMGKFCEEMETILKKTQPKVLEM